MDLIGSLRSTARAGFFLAWTGSVVASHRALRNFRDGLDTPDGKRPFIARWGSVVFPIFGIDLAVTGAPPEGGPYLVVSNHRSPFDILIAVHLVGGVVLSHHGVARVPVIGTAAKATDTIFVDRADAKSGARAIREMRSRLREGRNVIVFPEGTTFPGDEVRPFKRGAFSAARGLEGVRVLPLGLAYEPGGEYFQETLAKHVLRIGAQRSTPISVAIGDPMPVPKNEREEETVREAIQTLVERARGKR